MSSDTQAIPRHTRPVGKNYKWVALSNTTLGVLLGSMDSSIILISMPQIFKGLGVNPLQPSETGNLLWMLLGYMVVTATLLVTLGRWADARGRVRIYNLGFMIFSIGSVLLYFVPELTPQLGDTAVFELIIFRLVQGVGAACLIANSTAILTDAFPPEERGLALGINMVAALGGSLVGLLLGGFLSAINWRWVFLISVPFGIIGTIWAYISLREQSVRRSASHIDLPGNFCLGAGLVSLLVALTYGLLPYGNSTTGWTNPLVIGGVVLGILLLVGFVFVEQRAPDPLFHLELFRIRPFTVGCIAQFLVSIAYGGLQLIFIIWLQGIWLPLHGYAFEDTPLWSAIYLLPLLIGYMIFGVTSGWLTHRLSPRNVTTGAMVVLTIAYMALRTFPANFDYPSFAIVLFIIGAGFGAFAAPNTTSVMNALPPEYRGVGSGMRSTFQFAGSPLSLSVYFTVLILALSTSLPVALRNGLQSNGIPADTAARVSNLPPTGALFAVFLGYNPVQTMVPPTVLQQLPDDAQKNLLSNTFFPNAISASFMDALRAVFLFSAGLALLAAIFSAIRGKRFVYDESTAKDKDEAGVLASAVMH
ncbi:MAG TPA: MFS transporter [Aggregatilineales bacterium]|nr:MFS transporter [Aggregatilineales bacterium]